jgi:hypothetical protein
METVTKDRQKVIQKIEGLEPTAYNSELYRQVSNLDGFKPLAWTPPVRQLYYHPEKELMLQNIEGDLILHKNPSEGTIEKAVQQYPKAEVCFGEDYDSRF